MTGLANHNAQIQLGSGEPFLEMLTSMDFFGNQMMKG
jgi:hypothetical protein